MAAPQAQKTLAFALVANEISRRHQVSLQEKQAQAAATKQLIPAVVDALATNERIFGHQKEAVAQALENPVKALELLRDVACHRNAGEIEKIGSAAETGTGNGRSSAAPGTDPYAGRAVSDYDATPGGAAFSNAILGSAR